MQGTKHNYKLEKAVAAAGAEDEIELVGGYTKSGAHLPIDDYGKYSSVNLLAKELIYIVDKNDVVLVMGETGSGKSTSKN
jgi:hypothetical protein